MHRTRNTLPSAAREQSVKLLLTALVDLLELRAATKLAHWNIKGPAFIAVHELLDKTVDDIAEAADTVAERAVQLGGQAVGTSRQVAAATTLEDFPADANAQNVIIKEVCDRLAAVGKTIRESIDKASDIPDAATADIFTQITRMIDLRLWFLESHLVGG